jgi:NADPH-dependent glutamate synthase beta subunit-like oxidoreductase/ferredoxin
MSVPKLRPDPLKADRQAEKIRSLIAGMRAPKPIGCAPCTHACPVGINVKGYIDAVSEGRFEDSLRLIREENPFAGVSGRICIHPCERECTRTSHGGPIGIRLLKRFVHDFVLASGDEPRGPRPDLSRGPVAVVGAGPAGLSAARDLARAGVKVVVFEAKARPGGMLRTAIPDFRLPPDVLQSDLDYVSSFGVEIRCNEAIGSPGQKSIEDLFREGFRTVFLATGAPRTLPSKIPGSETCKGVTDTLSLLRDFKAGRAAAGARKAAVLGGSFEAVAAARALKRLGVPEVSIYYPQSLRELPADPDDLQAALLEGVVLKERTRVLEIIAGEGNRAAELLAAELSLGSPDTSGRVTPEGKSRSRVPADFVVLELAREPNWSVFSEGTLGIPKTLFNTPLVDPVTLALGRDGLFAGGDLVSGPKTMIEAVAHGRRAAASILRFLGHADGDSMPARTKTFTEPVRYEIPVAPASEPGLRPVERGYGENEAMAEAFRCLRCGPCGECLACSPHCGHRYVALPQLDGLLLRMEGIETDALTAEAGTATIARVDPDLCRGCGRCEEVCGSHAPRVVPRIGGDLTSAIDPDACRSCGCCVAHCPTGAIRQGFFTKEWLEESIAAAAAWSRPGDPRR